MNPVSTRLLSQQLVAAEDYAWMRVLTAPKARQVISGWMSSNKIVIPESEKLSVRELRIDVAQRSMSSTREDFETALADQGLSKALITSM